VFNDGAEKSRYLVQLAAIQASSIYTISPLPTYADDGGSTLGRAAPPSSGRPTSGGPTSRGPVTPGPGPFSTPAVAGAATPRSVAVSAGAASGLAFVVRSPMQAISLAGVLLLFAAAALGLRRRAALLEVLRGKGR